ncbi:DUF4446 family protein [Brevibacillus sp. B_LB10_24]|uniref:DUF4446 family protein n=1 Tax=Brevibacillus sp. B_LB10_24 TaxID=3380645 RepID=UPI0038B7DECE
MQQLLSILSSPYISAALCLMILILLIFVTVLNSRISRLQRKMKRFLAGSDGGNIEAGLTRMLDQLDEYKQKQADQQFMINRLSQKLTNRCGNLAVIRYNAFDDTGSDLSFSLALLDDEKNGVVLTSIFGRHESRIYAKPVQAGESTYLLTEEETDAIRKASQLIGLK